MLEQSDPLTMIRDFVYQAFPLVKQRKLSDEESLVDNGIVDSLGILEIVTFVESEFSLIMDDDEMLADHFESIASIATLVVRKQTEVQS